MDKPICLCDRCGEAMRCLLNYDGKACRKNRTVEPNNADRIRAMSDKELAWAYAMRMASCYGCEASTIEDCAKCTLDWLRKEADVS